MSKYFSFIWLLIVLLAACGAGDNGREPGQTPAPDMSEERTMTSTPIPDMDDAPPTPTPDDAAGSEPVSGAASEPVVVDMGELTPQPGSSDEPVVQPAPGQPGPAAITVPEAYAPFAQEMVTDLSQRLEVAPEHIRVTGWQAVTWSDGSLGCPQPGMMYTQALVEGYQVTLWVDGQTYAYHTQGLARFILCDNGPKVVPPAAADE